ncbi:hypothetical protein [Ammoniphilus sp. 3BR4]|uniref:hypothetical protein n=1 Tax=Ammoniphilus sp. 3BR4 TaxID=3158265 RepID=UPI0034671932
MEPYRTQRKLFYLILMFFAVFIGWMLFSVIDTGQAEKNIIDKETLRLQVNYSPVEQ